MLMLVALVAGLVFGLGLTVAGMVNPGKVLGFLDFAGQWDPSLAFVLGGAVKGKAYYGTPPVVANNGPDDIGQGRLIPTTSVDQYAATMASWFGVSDSDMPTVLPNIGNYTTKNLGFV